MIYTSQILLPGLRALRLVQGIHPSEVFSSIAALLDDHGWGATESTPFIGSKAFGGSFSSTDARRGGFFKLTNRLMRVIKGMLSARPELRQAGVVTEIEMLESDGALGLLRNGRSVGYGTM